MNNPKERYDNIFEELLKKYHVELDPECKNKYLRVDDNGKEIHVLKDFNLFDRSVLDIDYEESNQIQVKADYNVESFKEFDYNKLLSERLYDKFTETLECNVVTDYSVSVSYSNMQIKLKENISPDYKKIINSGKDSLITEMKNQLVTTNLVA